MFEMEITMHGDEGVISTRDNSATSVINIAIPDLGPARSIALSIPAVGAEVGRSDAMNQSDHEFPSFGKPRKAA